MATDSSVTAVLVMRTLKLLALSLAWMPMTAAADVAGAINHVRSQGCAGSPGNAGRLRADARLDAAARRLSGGESLDAATQRAGYRALRSTSVQITNVPDDRDIERIVAQQFCARVSDRGLRDIGAYRRGEDVWLIIAAPIRAACTGRSRSDRTAGSAADESGPGARASLRLGELRTGRGAGVVTCFGARRAGAFTGHGSA